MKKSIISPLCSALIIPGFGQLLNQQLKKGGFFLASVFLLFLTSLIKIVFALRQATGIRDSVRGQKELLSSNMHPEDLLILLVPFAILWIISVVDAFLVGRKLDRLEE